MSYVTKMTADYIWDNRDKGWGKNAAIVQNAIPEICRRWAIAIRDELGKCGVCAKASIERNYFSVTIRKPTWSPHYLIFACESGWALNRTWFGINTENGTNNEDREELRKALDEARSDHSSDVVRGGGANAAYFYSQALAGEHDMVRPVAEELQRLTCELDNVLTKTTPGVKQ